ncbi:MAG: triose-phosphate isomerase [Janthinobacterium lividum]
MRPIVAGNWKMNGLAAPSLALATALRDAAPSLPCDLVVCPPFTQLTALAAALRGSAVALGAQDCHQIDSGPHTGDISAPMLAECGATHVILGHSERRLNHGEIDETVRQKAKAALAAGLTPIVCVGESADQRAAGAHQDTVGWMIEGSLPEGFRGIVAYEPIWAIGAGSSATAEDIAAMHAFVHAELSRQFPGAAIPLLYGGSVNPGNARDILAIPHVGGALVGGASLNAEDFLAIARAATPG